MNVTERKIGRHDLGRHFIYIFRKRKISPASGIDLYCNCTYVYEAIRNIKYEHATRRRNTHCHTDFNF